MNRTGAAAGRLALALRERYRRRVVAGATPVLAFARPPTASPLPVPRPASVRLQVAVRSTTVRPMTRDSRTILRTASLVLHRASFTRLVPAAPAPIRTARRTRPVLPVLPASTPVRPVPPELRFHTERRVIRVEPAPAVLARRLVVPRDHPRGHDAGPGTRLPEAEPRGFRMTPAPAEVDVRQLTEQVLRQLDRRACAHRERQGRP